MPQPCTAEDPKVDALKAGSEHAFRCLFEQERERLHNFVWKIVGDADEAENIVQEAFAEAYRQIDSFRGEAKVSTWLFSIARHLAYGHVRKSKRHNYKEHEILEFLQAEQNEGTTVTEKAVETAERKRIVHDALQELPEHYRRVVQLRDLEEKSTTETAERLGLTEVNVRVRLHRARKQLRGHLCKRMEY
ncbi:sigma-70 family RNA polymerase sigma factor [Salinibacter sp. 10B]|uniref:RNA polymerase sigma factor n=1 Tax=Salinibacter sp. 10B TaxID=1923971 RepID=UPI0021576BED|nr:sigma-70 family RNA polymerase sigma factor [Salinibacter sp. 10B]